MNVKELTIIDTQVKEAVASFCEKRGIKLRYLVEQALLEQLEDEIDLEANHARHNEDTVSLEQVLAKRNKKRQR